MKKIVMMVMVGLFLIGTASTAKAVILLPGQGDTATTGAGPSLGYGTLLTTLVVPFSFGSLSLPMVGTVTESVYRNSGGLLFTYDLNRSADGINEGISRLSVNGLLGYTVDADYDVSSSGTQSAVNIDRHSDNVVGFDYNPAIKSGIRSELLWIQTDAQYYGPTGFSLQDGRSENLNGLGPAIPEPATASLFGMGLLGLLGFRRRMKA